VLTSSPRTNFSLGSTTSLKYISNAIKSLNLFKINLTKVEQLGTGAVHAQILDIIYPGEVALHKVNWKARLEWEFVNNFKVLQQAFAKAGITKYIDVTNFPLLNIKAHLFSQ